LDFSDKEFNTSVNITGLFGVVVLYDVVENGLNPFFNHKEKL